jgi:long-chain acyl-CoA synthetase
MNLYEFLLQNADGNKMAIVSRQEAVTYSGLTAMAERIASRLRQAGILKGNRVAILAENSSFWAASYLGILKAGAVAVPMPLRLSAEALRTLIDLTQCGALCIDARRLAKFKAVLPAESTVITPELVVSDTVITADGQIETCAVNERDDLAALMFTSGSTGQPNAVKVTHRNIMANTESIISYLGLTEDDKIMVVLPFDYCFGTSLLHTHLRAGGTLVINNTFLYVENVLEDMEHFGCTGLAGVPTIYQHLLRRSTLKTRQLSTLRYAQQAGGRLPDTFIREFTEALPEVKFYAMYGQTEATARLSYLPPDALDTKLGSIGRGMPGVTLRVLDRDGQPVRPGEVGEIVAEGDNVAAGYWIPDPAKQPFRDGKLYTGDIAQVDDDGFIFIVGRNSEFLKLNGHRVSSSEIEEALCKLPEVLEVAVVGVQNDDLGEVAKAYVVARRGSGLTPNVVLRHCKTLLPPFAVPHEIEFMAELPKNSAGKILKRELQAKVEPTAEH